MAATFEEALATAQAEMISISLEYVAGRAEAVYAFGLSTTVVTSFDVFYRIGGAVYQTHKVNDAVDGGPLHDVSAARQLVVQKFGIRQLQGLRAAAESFGSPMPILIKSVYDVREGRLSSDLRYDDFYSDSNRSPDEFFQDWFDEQARA